MFANKSNEGALYHDFTSGRAKFDDVVNPNQTHVYTWSVPELVGPTREDAQCITSAYYSAVNPIKDSYSGSFPLLLTFFRGGRSFYKILVA